MDWDFVKFMGGTFIGGFLLFMGLAIIVYVLVYFASIPQCTDFQKQTGRETKMTFWNGCLVNTPQGWISGSKLIVNNPTEAK